MVKIGQPLVSVGREQQVEEELRRLVGLLFSSFSFPPWPLVVAEKWEGPGRRPRLLLPRIVREIFVLILFLLLPGSGRSHQTPSTVSFLLVAI